MKFESSQVVPFPPVQVFELVRDRMQDLLPHMPNVEKIEIESREDLGGGRTRMVNRWHGKAEIPKVAQGIIKLVQSTGQCKCLCSRTWNRDQKRNSALDFGSRNHSAPPA